MALTVQDVLNELETLKRQAKRALKSRYATKADYENCIKAARVAGILAAKLEDEYAGFEEIDGSVSYSINVLCDTIRKRKPKEAPVAAGGKAPDLTWRFSPTGVVNARRVG